MKSLLKTITRFNASVDMKKYTGDAILQLETDFAKLRINIFCEPPYLYDGSLEDEKGYLRHYAASDKSVIITLEHNGKLIGGITGTPLSAEPDYAIKPFQGKNIDVENYLYLGEMLIEKDFRRMKLSNDLLVALESFAKEEGYDAITFCRIERNDLSREEAASWYDWGPNIAQQGYVERPDIVSKISWKEVNKEQESLHDMVYWIKDLRQIDRGTADKPKQSFVEQEEFRRKANRCFSCTIS